MEELEKLNRQTKIIRNIFLIKLILDIILFTILFIELKKQEPPLLPVQPDVIVEQRYLFNSKFNIYLGRKKGQYVIRLFEDVNANNITEEEHQVKLTGITDISEIDDNIYYNIIPSYSDNGYIKKINIEISEE